MKMYKRKFDELEDNNVRKTPVKNSLDSDEEDDDANEDNYNIMSDDEIEGAEDGPSAPETNVGFTAFNMKEELEEGHFDKQGHYLWNKEKEIRDNWLDNIDWMQIKASSTASVKKESQSSKTLGLAHSDSEDEDPDIMFNPTQVYKQILEYLQPGETVSKALCRLGKGKKRLTTAERWKRKQEKKPIEDDQNSISITKLTELANELLTRTGNMDIYQESYEQIKKKVELGDKHAHPSKQEAELDMYADDFDVKEKAKLDENESNNKGIDNSEAEEAKEVTWELKWSQDENAEVYGPHTSEQMNAWAREGYFKSGAWVRRTGQNNQFYDAARVDFELYL
ncbi:CD2 antigen cytoplasmic tail-binding protein 2 homolog [Bombus vosnesenskii]|uniref:CD2 antigen cytoplasmic tail-binding protein 2 homolog n=3 Tax=Pyrobombus TaxID=144703 RepID=A0A6J3L6Y9_9HYME|nr:CD2 antigen cytoplasmic tail-binding protein 2 homolog [Bombus impatiens]XP_033204898.1 CD2 antigen cytoplasmic tail-binding protein 2 homolog [Bombus vancouverensis nearcticus]XP_033303097.1 CD2 antigen cytoplasmic tail-binding protein 2 homolog [Bombus bifarius]XP_033361005.1 CD2 antigen cytoplasmic tail-binding protein 2 homolog [Bombus vosnesenskii]